MNPRDGDQATQGATVVVDDDAVAVGQHGMDAARPAAALDQNPAEKATPKGGAAESRGPSGDQVMKAEFQPLPDSVPKGEGTSLDLLMDVPLPVSVQLGRTTVTLKQVLDLGQGSVIELDRVAGEPVDVYVSGKILGRGEIVVVNDRFGVRMTEILSIVRG